MIRLRPHHALCLQTYVGKGYSNAFSENMTKISQALNQRPTQMVHFTLGADEICAACPNLQNGVCSKEDSCAKLDRLAWEAMALGCGEVLSWEEATQLVRAEPVGNREIPRPLRWLYLGSGLHHPAADRQDCHF